MFQLKDLLKFQIPVLIVYIINLFTFLVALVGPNGYIVITRVILLVTWIICIVLYARGVEFFLILKEYSPKRYCENDFIEGFENGTDYNNCVGLVKTALFLETLIRALIDIYFAYVLYQYVYDPPTENKLTNEQIKES